MIVTILTRSKVMLIHLLYDLPFLCSILHITGPNEAKTGEIEVLPMLRSRCSRVSSPIIFDQRSVTDPAHLPLSSLVIVAQVDPKFPLPQSVMNFIIKNIAGIFLSLFQRQVAKVDYSIACSIYHIAALYAAQTTNCHRTQHFFAFSIHDNAS